MAPDDTLTPIEHLALVHAPAPVRDAWRGFLLLDRRLADAAQSGREPLMVQIRLAWWRERFAEPAQAWPQGEPLLALLGKWDSERAALAALVDGWEARHIGEDGGAALGEARIGAVAALARLSGVAPGPDLRRAAAEWLGLVPFGPAPRLPRALRPLAILRGGARAEAGTAPAWQRAAAMLRIAFLGR